jgi:DNA end-binding protein Ku
MPTTCPIHGQVERAEIIKGYEFEKDKYVVIEQEELDKIKLRSEKTIELTKFVPADSVQDVYLDAAYYMAPDGPVAEEPFRIVREALEKTGTAGIGKLTISGRERPVLLRPGERGFTLNTLHAANEVKDAAPYFEEIKVGAAINKEHMQLATTLIKGKLGEFDPSEFHDTYQDALVELVKSKIAGQAPVIVQEEELPATFNFAEALKQSLRGGRQAGGQAGRRRQEAPGQERAGRGQEAEKEASLMTRAAGNRSRWNPGSRLAAGPAGVVHGPVRVPQPGGRREACVARRGRHHRGRDGPHHDAGRRHARLAPHEQRARHPEARRGRTAPHRGKRVRIVSETEFREIIGLASPPRRSASRSPLSSSARRWGSMPGPAAMGALRAGPRPRWHVRLHGPGLAPRRHEPGRRGVSPSSSARALTPCARSFRVWTGRWRSST